MRRWLAVALLVALATSAFSWPDPGTFPARGFAARSFPARSFARYGAASPPAVVSSGNAAARIITLLGCLALVFGSLGWAGCYWQQHSAREAMHRRLNAVVAELATIYEANAKAEFARRLIEDKSG
jgi:hypothetical protein